MLACWCFIVQIFIKLFVNRLLHVWQQLDNDDKSKKLINCSESSKNNTVVIKKMKIYFFLTTLPKINEFVANQINNLSNTTHKNTVLYFLKKLQL